jgi:hypothetical protein
MTDVADRPSIDLVDDVLSWPDPLEQPPEPPGREDRTPRGWPGRILLSVLGAAVALLAIAAMERHLGSSAVALLALVAWLEITLAVLMVARPSRALLVWALIGSAVLVVVGLTQLWWGHHAPLQPVEWLRLALESAAVVVCAVLLGRPRLGQTWDSSTAVVVSVVPVAVIVATVVLLVGQTPVLSTPTHVASAAPPPGQASVVVPGQNSSRFQQIASGNDSEKSELKPYVPLDPTTQAQLTQQLAVATQAAERFPTVAAAKAAGMVLAGGMAPGVGAHFQVLSAASLQGINPDGSVNPAEPASWIYASTADNAPVVGIMYESLSDQAPSGFAGPNDHWHQHSNLCITFRAGEIGVPFAPDASVTPQECRNVHGVFMKKTVWMVHAWVLPGWESPAGVFSHANTHIYCPGNTDLVDAIGFCERQA